MKRREKERQERREVDDQQLAQAALAELRAAWKRERRPRTKRARDAANLMRLAAETRELLALWTYYRLACVEALESTHLGAA